MSEDERGRVMSFAVPRNGAGGLTAKEPVPLLWKAMKVVLMASDPSASTSGSCNCQTDPHEQLRLIRRRFRRNLLGRFLVSCLLALVVSPLLAILPHGRATFFQLLKEAERDAHALREREEDAAYEA